MRAILRQAARTATTLSSITAICLAIVLQAQTPYGFALTDGGGRLTDLGAYALLLSLVAIIVAMLPLARWIDETGRWSE